jgi:3-dehydroquinate dehydratase-2
MATELPKEKNPKFADTKTTMEIYIINGPNLNLTGKREPEIYGQMNFEEMIKVWEKKFNQLNLQYRQSNVEGEIINLLHAVPLHATGIVLNPGGYSHTSVAIADAIRAIEIPVVEVHISNIAAREEYRRNSLTAAACKGVISGFGMQSYELAIKFFSE